MADEGADQQKGLCGDCRHFVGDPQALERVLPGLRALSSAFGSVRADSGWCALLDRFAVARDECADFAGK
ncbi:MAG: hypothetical protein HQL53_11795 [Magnetococcales bacterium]|nr:hypothetical protein [Magnetococcales bacterium]